ncbi:hypothetical protein ACFLSI_01595 [Bacteroidota bacterium]
MNIDSKLNSTNYIRIITYSILILAVAITGIIVIRESFSAESSNKIFGIIYFIISVSLLLVFLRYKTTVMIPVILLNMSMSISYFAGNNKLMIIPNVLLIVVAVYIIYFFIKHISLKRKILELAARPVDGVESGYTGRPYPAGKISYSKGELHGFSELMKRLLIAVPINEKDGISFSLSDDWFGRLYNIHSNYVSETRIIFNYDGNISVNISKGDYKKYHEELTFDQLCNSMGSLFIYFFELFNRGEGDRILNKINKSEY